MLWREHHIGRTEQSVRARCKNPDWICFSLVCRPNEGINFGKIDQSRIRNSLWIFEQLSLHERCAKKIIANLTIKSVLSFLQCPNEDAQHVFVMLLYRGLKEDKSISSNLVSAGGPQVLKKIMTNSPIPGNKNSRSALVKHAKAVLDIIS